MKLPLIIVIIGALIFYYLAFKSLKQIMYVNVSIIISLWHTW